MENINKPGYLFVLPWGVEAVGGVNEVVLNLYDEINRGGKYRPMILVNRWACVKPEMQLVDGRDIINLRLRAPYSSERTFLRLLLFFFYFPFNALNLHRILKAYNVKVVNPHYPELTLYIFFLLKKFKIYKGKFIISIHGMDVKSLEGVDGLRKKLWLRMLKGSHHIVACSHALKQEAVSILGLSAKRFSVVHNGVNDSFLTSSIKESGYCFRSQLKSVKYILNVATFEPKKGQDVLIKSFHIVSARFPEFKLILVGRRTEYLDDLKRLVSKLGLEGRVAFFTDIPHAHMNQFFEYAQFFVLPSRFEPFGIVLLEAGLFELPVVASNVGGVSEIIENWINGRLVKPGDIDELQEVILYFCMNMEKANLMGVNLREKVREHFSWSVACRHYISYVHEPCKCGNISQTD